MVITVRPLGHPLSFEYMEKIEQGLCRGGKPHRIPYRHRTTPKERSLHVFPSHKNLILLEEAFIGFVGDSSTYHVLGGVAQFSSWDGTTKRSLQKGDGARTLSSSSW
jgi:hypothetical protein